MIKIIVAHDRNRVIGHEMKLPWHLPKDLEYLRDLTLGTPIVMGRKTFESIGRVLPGRENIVLTTQKINNKELTVIDCIDTILERFLINEDCYVFGGQSVYEVLLPYAERIHLTYIDEKFEGDTFFPVIDKSKWKKVSVSSNQLDEENKLNFYFIEYKRARND